MSHSGNTELSTTYQKKTQKEHIKDAPDTYIGGIEEDRVINWTMAEEKMIHSEYGFIPGLYKCFDEGIVNCRDHWIRLLQKKNAGEDNIIPVTQIDIEVDQSTGIITMMNNGNGIDIAKHPEHNIYIPEMIFGHLLTSRVLMARKDRLANKGLRVSLVLMDKMEHKGLPEKLDHKVSLV